jgi:integrating conjugative element protein (TIGR03758 family)
MGFNYGAFLEALAQRESSGQLDKISTAGYLGLYQMGEAALIDAGYYRADGTAANDWVGTWTGKDGIDSRDEYLTSREVQNNAVAVYHQAQWRYLTSAGLTAYIGQTVGGVLITESGLLAGAHLGGTDNVRDFLRSGGSDVFRDGLGTPITQYLSMFGNYDVTIISRGSWTPIPVPPVTGGGGSEVGAGTGTGTGVPLDPGQAFASGSGVAPEVLYGAVVALIAMLALTWAAWAVQAQWSGWVLRKVNTGDLIFMAIRVCVVLSMLLYMVLL